MKKKQNHRARRGEDEHVVSLGVRRVDEDTPDMGIPNASVVHGLVHATVHRFEDARRHTVVVRPCTAQRLEKMAQRRKQRVMMAEC